MAVKILKLIFLKIEFKRGITNLKMNIHSQTKIKSGRYTGLDIEDPYCDQFKNASIGNDIRFLAILLLSQVTEIIIFCNYIFVFLRLIRKKTVLSNFKL